MADSASKNEILRSDTGGAGAPPSENGDGAADDEPTVVDASLNPPPKAKTTDPAANDVERRNSADGVEVIDDQSLSGSGTKTTLHQRDGQPRAELSEDELQQQKTVISRRPQPVPPHLSSPRDLGSLLEGEQLGHFRLDEFVGGGGMGAVFRGTDLQLGRTVAVKVLSRDQGADPETLRRFKNEAQSAARLDHDNIARVFFVGEHEGWNFIVFEYIEGINLRDLIERGGPLPLDQAIDYVVQIAEALEHAAAREVVHRDIKPSNVLIAPDGRAKLVDMGLARLHHMEAGHSDLTASGVTLGTFDYISPEQASDPRRADVRSDLYSLGCTLYFMLVGRPPFPHGTVLQKLLAHSGETPPDPRVDQPDLPAELTKIIFRMLAKRPEQRYQQPREFILEMLVLRDQLGYAPLPLSLTSSRPSGTTWAERWLPIALPALLLIVVLFGWDAYWNRTASSAAPPGFQVPPGASNDAGVGTIGEQRPTVDSAPSRGGTNDGSDRPASNPLPADNTGRVESSSATDVTSGNDFTSGNKATSVQNGSANSEPDDNGSETPATSTPQPAPAATPAGGSQAPVGVEPEKSPPLLQKIVIGDASSIGDLGPAVRIFPSLSDALASDDFRNNLQNLEAIEIRGTIQESTPLSIRLPADQQLTIRGVAEGGVLPEIRFAAEATTTPNRQRGMIEFVSGKLTLENMHLKMRVATDVDPASDLALMRLSSSKKRQLEMSKCIITVENPTFRLAETVAFFDIAPPDNIPADQSPERVRFHFRDCVLRGEATVMRMRESLPLQIVWQNGLLATSGRLLLAEGTSRRVDDTIRVSLLNVTAEVGQGLCLMRDTGKRPNQPGLELVCNKTIVSANSSNLVEHVGTNTYDVYRRLLFVRGDTNAYEDVGSFWSVDAEAELVSDDSKPDLDWPAWNEKLRMSGGMPSSVSPVGWERFRSDVAGIPMHQRSVSDYLIDASDPGSASDPDPNPELIVIGVQSAEMPLLPDEVGEAAELKTDEAT